MTFWHKRWQTEQIGWHRDSFNDMLTKHWGNIDAVKGCEVLVPLCGKSLDMVWLANQGHNVIGMEFVSDAIQAFFEENRLTPVTTVNGNYTQHQSKPFTILEGDIFELESNVVQADSWYDRAAMVAIEPSLRKAYVDQLRKATKNDAVGLMITYTNPQQGMDGPPYSLTDEDVAKLFSEGFEWRCLEKISLDPPNESDPNSPTSTVFEIRRAPRIA